MKLSGRRIQDCPIRLGNDRMKREIATASERRFAMTDNNWIPAGVYPREGGGGQ